MAISVFATQNAKDIVFQASGERVADPDSPVEEWRLRRDLQSRERVSEGGDEGQMRFPSRSSTVVDTAFEDLDMTARHVPEIGNNFSVTGSLGGQRFRSQEHRV